MFVPQPKWTILVDMRSENAYSNWLMFCVIHPKVNHFKYGLDILYFCSFYSEYNHVSYNIRGILVEHTVTKYFNSVWPLYLQFSKQYYKTAKVNRLFVPDFFFFLTIRGFRSTATIKSNKFEVRKFLLK